jgi:regulatory protein YycI of two-component signal transduction system YycFG
MKKPYNIIFILILLANVIMGIMLFQQSAQLTEFEHILSNLEVRMEDLDDAHETDIVPRLEEILNEN